MEKFIYIKTFNCDHIDESFMKKYYKNYILYIILNLYLKMNILTC